MRTDGTFIVLEQSSASSAGWGYTYTVTAGEAQITKYTGTGGVVTIPSTLGGAPVTSIGFNAFYNCTGLTSISLPQGVTSIGQNAFFYCQSLTSISIPQRVASIGVGAFTGCTGLTTITFNSAITTIYDSADTIPAATKIIGYDPSTAKDYATKYGITFESLGAPASTPASTPTTSGIFPLIIVGVVVIAIGIAIVIKIKKN